ncbi:MAG: NAD-dependent epimerase/dehydratase family protein, partial [Candidatus Omnitrophica bacterium]|nr:NAD-dependent epimerase/dehydratase family protein [Candidatus Omnitrophota bacterium]
MKYLITGGAGFIGSHLIDALISDPDNDITVIDDFSTGSIENICHHLKNRKFHLFIDSILNKYIVEQLCSQVDFIFHLAAAVGVKTVLEKPLESIEINIQGSKNVFEAAAKYKKQVLFTSTSEIYGKNEKVPFNEEDDIIIGSPSKKRWGYACSKALDEFLGLACAEEINLNIIIVRLFNTVGPRQTERYGMVLPRFVKQALANQPITIFGNGSQTRCFTHVKDVVTALLKLSCLPEANRQIINVGSTEEISILNLAQLVKKIAKSDSEIVF